MFPEACVESFPRVDGRSLFEVLCITISDDRGDEFFADDLNMGRGIVSGRVALLLRSTEIRPHVPIICPSISDSVQVYHHSRPRTTLGILARTGGTGSREWEPRTREPGAGSWELGVTE